MENRMAVMGLTRAQHQVLLFLENYIATNGYSPSFDEIRTGLELRSKSEVHRIVHALKQRGHVDMLPQRARSLVVVREVAE